MTFLAAVQSKLEPEAYRTSAGFAAWIFEQTKKALVARDVSEPALLAFPELIGLPLMFFLERSSSAIKIQEAALELSKEHWLTGLKLGWQQPRLTNVLLPRAVQVHQAMLQAFAQAAQAHNTYIVAGSSFLPFVDEEAAQGVFIANSRVENVSFLFAPTGRLLSRTAKIHLTKGFESHLGLQPARLEDWLPSLTKLGKIGTLICYDAFFDSCIARADATGTQILVQPSANAAVWTGAWSANASLIEGQEWVARGAMQRIQNCENIQAVINPMLVGQLFDLRFEGCSSIGFNAGEAIFATNHTDFAVVSAVLK
jgi:predicted amidohydrolase